MCEEQKSFKFGLRKSSFDESTEQQKLCFSYNPNVVLPNKYSLRDKIKYIWNQGNINSCSANAVSNQLMLSDKKQVMKFVPSRLYIYYNSRMIDNEDVSKRVEDVGASLKSVYKSILNYNIISEDVYPYDVSKVNSVPPPEIYKEAMFKNMNPIFSYRRLCPSLYSFKYVISQLELPILFGMAVYSNFMKLNKQNDLLNEPNNDFLGLHGVLMIGYDDSTETVTVVNSHGENFGNNGTFRMSFRYLMNEKLSFEHWVINSE